MITEIRSGNNVRRFHTTFRQQEETNGHHSANVCAILLRLHPSCSRELLVAALMHDVPEVYTGDVPAPCKWDCPNIKKGLDECEQQYIMEYELPNPELTAVERTLLKLADMTDLVLSSLEELGKGNHYAQQLVTNGQQYIIDMRDAREITAEQYVTVSIMMDEVKEQWQQTTDK